MKPSGHLEINLLFVMAISNYIVGAINQSGLDRVLLCLSIGITLVNMLIFKFQNSMNYLFYSSMPINTTLSCLGTTNPQFMVVQGIFQMGTYFSSNSRNWLSKASFIINNVVFLYFVTEFSILNIILSIICGLCLGLCFIHQNQPDNTRFALPLTRKSSTNRLLRDDTPKLTTCSGTRLNQDQITLNPITLEIMFISQSLRMVLIDTELDNLMESLMVLKIDKQSEMRVGRVKNKSLKDVVRLLLPLSEPMEVIIMQTSMQQLDNYLIKLLVNDNILLQFEEITQWKSYVTKQYSMQMMNQIFKSFSHEFGTQLNQITLYTQIAQERLQLNQANSDLQQILRSCSIMQAIVADLRDFYSIHTNRFQLELSNFEVEVLFRELSDLYRNEAKEKQIQIQFHNNWFGKTFQQDGRRIKQVLINLIQNSFKFTPPGGTISIEVESVDANLMRFTVEDSGIGMTIEEINRLSDMLRGRHLNSRVSKHSAGMGLGCFISNKIIKRLSQPNKEHLQFMSLNQGCRFWFNVAPYYIDQDSLNKSIDACKQNSIQRLDNNIFVSFNRSQSMEPPLVLTKALSCPAQTKPQLRVSPIKQESNFWRIDEIREEQYNQSLNQEKCTQCAQILVVDDDISNIMALTMLMRILKYDCDQANNGSEAIAKIQSAKHCQYKLIFMDINMPIMDGIQATKIIRQMYNDQEMTIVCCTAVSDIETKKEALDAGMNEVLEKPIQRDKLNVLLELYL